MIYDNKFNRFDNELINKYFNEKGKQAIKDYILELIGEDEDNPAPKEPWGATYRNELRAEFRKKVAEL